MPLLDIQRQFRQLGRLRMGARQAFTRKDGSTGERPIKLAAWRLTTPWRHLLDAAVDSGIAGEVRAWSPEEGRDEWELVTSLPAIRVLIPPGEVLSQWNETWSGGGCQRRCDGVTMIVDQGRASDHACRCPADPAERNLLAQKGKACKPTTRLKVMLPNLPDLGIWRLETHGYYAAVELGGAAELLAIAAERGNLIPADLRIEARQIRRPGEVLRRFGVPVISLPFRLGDTLTALGFGDHTTDAVLAPGTTERRPALNAGGTPPHSTDPTYGHPAPMERAAIPAGPTLEVAPAQPAPPPQPDATPAPAPDTAPIPTPEPPTDSDEYDPELEPAPQPLHPNWPGSPPEESGGSSLPIDRALAKLAGEHGITDDARHDIYRLVTQGRTATGKELTHLEAQRARGIIVAGRITIEPIAGGHAFTDAKGIRVEVANGTIARVDQEPTK